MSENSNHLETAIVENGKWVDKVFATGAAISTIILTLKFINVSEFEWNGVTVSVENTRFLISICVAFTVAHWYASRLLIRSILEFWKLKSHEDRIKLLETLRATGGLLVRGFIPRERARIRKDLYIYTFNIKDYTFWVSYGCIAVLLLAISPWNLSNKAFLFLLVTAIATAIINWKIASDWIVALTEISLQNKDEAYYLRSITGDEKYVPKVEKPLFPLFYSVVNFFPFTLDYQILPNLILILVLIPVYIIVGIVFILISVIQKGIELIKKAILSKRN
ncbi:MAG: hypothetical protein HC899_36015 [Leptolyngbyaceae cyanobacterium SM1_4_3]|nr:hypothetical protein [Leptolyngbyaceae cyanobacterium SM1_4_3]